MKSIFEFYTTKENGYMSYQLKQPIGNMVKHKILLEGD